MAQNNDKYIPVYILVMFSWLQAKIRDSLIFEERGHCSTIHN